MHSSNLGIPVLRLEFFKRPASLSENKCSGIVPSPSTHDGNELGRKSITKCVPLSFHENAHVIIIFLSEKVLLRALIRVCKLTF
jgi:hypothetical protein